MKPSLTIILLCMAGAALAADEPDAQAVGAERSRLGNARIQQDMERRARAEEQRVQPEQQRIEPQQAPSVPQSTSAPTPPAANAPQPAAAIASPPAGNSGMSETLELLQKLGELKDAGYVTEDEYSKLKQRVLADQL